MADWTTIGASLAAAFVGGAVAPFFSQRRERLDARADARRGLTEVEALRWEPTQYREFTRALATFEASALLAGIPWKRVVSYNRAVQAARSRTEFMEAVGPNDEDGWGIRDAATIEAHQRAIAGVTWACGIHG